MDCTCACNGLMIADLKFNLLKANLVLYMLSAVLYCAMFVFFCLVSLIFQNKIHLSWLNILPLLNKVSRQRFVHMHLSSTHYGVQELFGFTYWNYLNWLCTRLKCCQQVSCGLFFQEKEVPINLHCIVIQGYTDTQISQNLNKGNQN